MHAAAVQLSVDSSNTTRILIGMQECNTLSKHIQLRYWDVYCRISHGLFDLISVLFC